MVWEWCVLLTLLDCVGVCRLGGQEPPSPWMCVALGSAIAVSVGDSLVRHPEGSFVPFVVEQWDLKGGKVVVYNEKRARKEISWEVTHQSPGGYKKR